MKSFNCCRLLLSKLLGYFCSESTSNCALLSDLSLDDVAQVEGTREVNDSPVNRRENPTTGKRSTAKHLPLVTSFFCYQLIALPLFTIYSCVD